MKPPPAADGPVEAAGDDTEYHDEWGVPRKFLLHYYEITGHPLREEADLDAIEAYPWPEDPASTFDFEGLGERARALQEDTDYAVVGYPGGGSLFEQAWYLRGYPELLMDFMINKDLAHALFRHILDVRKKCAELYLNEVGDYLDVIQCPYCRSNLDDLREESESAQTQAERKVRLFESSVGYLGG